MIVAEKNWPSVAKKSQGGGVIRFGLSTCQILLFLPEVLVDFDSDVDTV